MNAYKNIRTKIKEIAFFLNDDTRKVREEALELAKFVENNFKNPAGDLDTNDMDKRYHYRRELYAANDIESENGFKQFFATGAVSVDDKIKLKLKIIENIYNRFEEIYNKYKYADEVWYLDKQSIGAGITHKIVIPRIPPGIDIDSEFKRGERAYGRFDYIGPIQNPSREARWSPDALIEIFDEFVKSVQAPVYFKNQLIGKISIHYNFVFMKDDHISNIKHYNILIISNQNTMIGMSPSASSVTGLREYKRRKWNSTKDKKAKMSFIDNELNIKKQIKSFAELLEKLNPEHCGEYEFSNKKCKIFKELIPEIDCQVIGIE